MKKFLILITILMMFAFVKFIYEFNKEIDVKKDWVEIQNVISDYENPIWVIVRNPRGRSLKLLGIKTKYIEIPYIWLILNRDDGHKHIRVGVEFYIKCNDVDEIIEHNEVNNNVKLFLKNKYSV